jgi:hypothetical protein
MVCEAPSGRIEGVEAFRRFLAPFAQMLTGDDQTAVVMSNPHTNLVADAPTAERFTVRDGKIVHDPPVVDRTPFDAARRRPA